MISIAIVLLALPIVNAQLWSQLIAPSVQLPYQIDRYGHQIVANLAANGFFMFGYVHAKSCNFIYQR